jgi:hypothetical protein
MLVYFPAVNPKKAAKRFFLLPPFFKDTNWFAAVSISGLLFFNQDPEQINAKIR